MMLPSDGVIFCGAIFIQNSQKICSTFHINDSVKFVCENFATVLSYVGDYKYGDSYAKTHVANDDELLGLW